MRRFLSISVLLQTVTVLMTLSLAAVCAIYAAGALRNQEEARRVPQILEISNDLYATLQNVRTERGNAFTLIEAASPITPVDRTDLDRLRKASDKALNAALRGLVAALLLYNIAAGAVLANAGANMRLVGVFMWPAVAVHAVLAVWCIACWWSDHPGGRSGQVPQ